MKKKLSGIKHLGKRIILRKVPLFILFLLALLVIPYPNPYFGKKGISRAEETDLQLSDMPAPLYPVFTGEGYPSLSADGILVKDAISGAVIYSKNPDLKFPSASTTKIMTALVGMEHFRLEDVLTVKNVISEPRVMNLIEGEKITFENLLYGTLVHSANDAAYTIAENYPGGVPAFVDRMNMKAAELMLEDTSFGNPIGFDGDNQYTTASDLARQALYALSDKTFSKIVSTKAITVSDTDFTLFHNLTNVNELLGKIPGVSGVKTGFTANAGEVLVSEVKKNGQDIILVVLRSKERFSDTSKLIDWVFKNHTWVPITELTGSDQD